MRPGLPEPDPVEVRIHRAIGRIGATLVALLGGAGLDRALDVVDRVRARALGWPLATDDPSLDRWLAAQAEAELAAAAIRLKLSDPGLEEADRIGVMLWSTHGALPPRVSEALVLRFLAGSSAADSAAILRATPVQLERLIGRAGRRIRALGLGIRSVGPCEQRLALKVAEQRLRGLLRQASRTRRRSIGAIEKTLTDWLDLIVRARSRRKPR